MCSSACYPDSATASNRGEEEKSSKEERRHAHTVDGGVGVEAVDLGDERGLGGVLGEVDEERADADVGAGVALHVGVGPRVIPAPHGHHRQPRHLRVTE